MLNVDNADAAGAREAAIRQFRARLLGASATLVLLTATNGVAQTPAEDNERKIKEIEDRALAVTAPKALPARPKATHTARDLCACSVWPSSLSAYVDAIKAGDYQRQAKVLGNGNIVFLKEGTPVQYLETEKSGLVRCVTINPVQEIWTTADKINPTK